MESKYIFAMVAGRKLKALRESSGYKRTDFSRLIHKSEQQLCRYERGINRIDIDTLVSALNILGVDIQIFFDELIYEVNNECVKS
ncbi:TPA: helix-turn-helix domain-containing protein [Providencia alcalifaciens]|nr:helix-turn-helix transcriptional regulator [Providencia alcalifaciens]